MSDFIADIANNENWRYLYSVNKEAVPKLNPKTGEYSGYYPMADLLIPLMITAPLIIVNIASYTAKSTWRYAGKITRSFPFSPVNPGDSVITESKNLIFDKWSNVGGSPYITKVASGQNLIIFDSANQSQYYNQYRINYTPPKWFIDFEIVVYQFTGDISFTYNLLDEEINRVNTRLTNQIERNTNILLNAIRNAAFGSSNNQSNQGNSPFGY